MPGCALSVMVWYFKCIVRDKKLSLQIASLVKANKLIESKHILCFLLLQVSTLFRGSESSPNTASITVESKYSYNNYDAIMLYREIIII